MCVDSTSPMMRIASARITSWLLDTEHVATRRMSKLQPHCPGANCYTHTLCDEEHGYEAVFGQCHEGANDADGVVLDFRLDQAA